MSENQLLTSARTGPDANPLPGKVDVAPQNFRALFWPLFWKRAALHLVMWLGETAVGLLPLIAYAMTFYFIDPTKVPGEGIKHAREGGFLPSALEEINILTIVIAGLSLVTLLKMDHQGLRCRFTPFTFSGAILCVLFTVCSSLLFAIDNLHVGMDNTGVTVVLLLCAILASLFMTVEQVALDCFYEISTKSSVKHGCSERVG